MCTPLHIYYASDCTSVYVYIYIYTSVYAHVSVHLWGILDDPHVAVAMMAYVKSLHSLLKARKSLMIFFGPQVTCC